MLPLPYFAITGTTLSFLNLKDKPVKCSRAPLACRVQCSTERHVIVMMFSRSNTCGRLLVEFID